MDIFQTIILALVQGFSEFLPISSSAHLILVPQLTHWNDQGLAFDVVVHLGTLSAVVYYYRTILTILMVDLFYSLFKGVTFGQAKMAWGVLLCTIPVGLVGLVFKDFIELNLRSPEVIAYATLVFGLLLGFASWLSGKNPQPKTQLTWLGMGFIGLMQTLALVPGTSRSGITITAGLLLGLGYKLTIKFAFLLSIPVIILAAISVLIELYHQPQTINFGMLFLGFAIAGLSAYWTIVFFIKLLDKIGMMPFVVYRLLLGAFLLIL